jgi:integrase
MAATKLTDRGVAAFETADARLDIWDEVVPGFGVRVTAHGTKTFFVRYRANGSNRRMKLGRYPVLTLADARKRAKEVLASTVLGADPALERRKRRAKDATFGALAREVLAAKAATTRASTRREREQVVRSDLLPEWGARPASGVERRDVALLVERIARRAPIKAGKTLAVIQWIYNEGLRRGFPGIEANPAHLLQPPVRPAVRTRFLDVDEIQTVWSLLDGESDATQCFFRFALLTAQRYGAVRAMRWPDIENGGTWRTPAAVFKGKRDHLTPLSAEALAALDKLRPLTGEGEYVFAGRAGGPRASIRTALTRLQQRSGIPRWTLHDFRRTFRTHAVRSPEDAGLGVAPNVADAVLGHKEASLGFDRYTGEPERYLLAEKRDALAKWGAFVAAAAVKDKR